MAQLSDQLVCYYKFDESSGNAVDQVSGNNLTNVGSIVYSAGKLGNGITLGTGKYMKFANADTIFGTNAQAWSINIWFKTPNNTVANLISTYFSTVLGDSTFSFDIWKNTDNTLQCDIRLSGTNKNVQGAVSVFDNAWHMATLTVDIAAGQLKLYCDGTLLNTTAIPTSGDYWDGGELHVGNVWYDNAESSPWNGMADELGGWTRAITQAEVTQLYNSGSALSYPFPVAGGGVGSYGDEGLSA